MMTFWAKVIEEAANSQEQELLRPRGDTGQVIAEKKAKSSTRTWEGSQRRQQAAQDTQQLEATEL